MSIQDLLSSAPSDAVDRYVRLVRETLSETDVALVEAMLLDGMTPWQASSRVGATSPKAPTTLFERARILAREIHAHFGESLDQWIDELAEDGEIRGVPHYLVADIRTALRRRGYQVVEEVVLRAKLLGPAEGEES